MENDFFVDSDKLSGKALEKKLMKERALSFLTG